MRLRANLTADLALVLTTLIWGSTFIMAKDILARWPPIAYLAFRFGLAALVLLMLFGREFTLKLSEGQAGSSPPQTQRARR